MPKSHSKIYLFILAVCAACLLTACSFNRVGPPPVGMETKPVTSHGYPVEKFKESNDCYNVEIEYPFLGRPELDQQVLVWVDTHYNDTAKEMEKICSNMPKDPHGPYTYKVTYEAAQAPGTISILFKSWLDTGGAHPANNLETLNLTVRNGEELRLEDLFADSDGIYVFLSDYVYRDLYPKLGDIWMGSPMFTEGLEPTADSFRNFMITPQGLTIYFPTYQIAPYSEGEQQSHIPLEQLIGFRPMPGIWQ